ncbi:MAG: phage portal protein, partial [Clostridiales bacterium]|nr:phage portal protein [Clostridiales bacterium]
MLFGNRPKPRSDKVETVKFLDGYTPAFHRFGGSIYESELVRAAIGAIATHISKLEVTTQGSAKPALQRKLTHGPNQVQTWSQFLYRLATILYVHNTAFIVPVYDPFGEVSGIYTVLPDKCELVTVGDDQTLFLRYKFGWGEWAAIEFDSCGVLTRYQYKSDLFGESNHALLPT